MRSKSDVRHIGDSKTHYKVYSGEGMREFDLGSGELFPNLDLKAQLENVDKRTDGRMAMKYAELLWESRRGASRMDSLAANNADDEAAILAKLKRLRRPAELRFNGRLVGGVDDLRAGLDNADDRRVRWNWWLETNFWAST